VGAGQPGQPGARRNALAAASCTPRRPSWLARPAIHASRVRPSRCCTLPQVDGAELALLLQHVEAQLGSFRPQELANALWGLARVSCGRPGSRLHEPCLHLRQAGAAGGALGMLRS
jgi:hypothetical protein